MSIQAKLEKIYGIQYFSIPKDYYDLERLHKWFVDTPAEASNAWLIPCSHVFYASATEAQISTLVSILGYNLPTELENLLTFTDGAKLFNLHYKPGEFDYWIARYNILGCADLIRTNQELLDTFLSYAEYDDKYRNTEKLNYLAFCEIGDGNYLAFILEGKNKGSIFFLDHDCGFYPFGDDTTKDAYTIVANSLDEWLEQLIKTEGQGGTGGRYTSL